MAEKDAIARAATWYALNRENCPRPVIPTLRETFGLSAKQAIDALRAGNDLRRASDA